MKFYTFTINVILAIAATAGIKATAHASTKYDFLAKQFGFQTAQPQATQSQATQSQATQSQATQPEPQAANSPVNQEGQTFFSHPPQLMRVAASQIGKDTPSTYEFALTVPKDAGRPLKAVTIAQATNVETVKFVVSSSKAFVGDRLTASSEIRLASVGGEQPVNPGEVTIVFDQPVQPGSTVTVALAAQRNPTWGGVYEFGVTAYPAGENGLGQFLGYGRLNFYGNSN
ncbi:DUF2808 domain-containing protein [Stenomitos frigidus]|uniref:DUF2808 domain-containing protein n=1 Tax=Stenomitos frigidus ULC18 TaxID=2107698 RepID=A0A2T1DVB7_9CYAN|nr:DUF2808 domain-containing protein [Stenomitos frigidus]PSB24430.1 hypothetical protein C7B82_27140 [Stenomitos frigidus ULC18]